MKTARKYTPKLTDQDREKIVATWQKMSFPNSINVANRLGYSVSQVNFALNQYLSSLKKARHEINP